MGEGINTKKEDEVDKGKIKGLEIKAKKTLEKIETIEDVYKKELLPLIKIFAPEGEDFDAYKERIIEDLRENVERIQERAGRLFVDPKESIREMKSILHQRAKAVLEDDYKTRHENKSIKPDLDLVKKSKIILLYEKDYSDWEKQYPTDDILNKDVESVIRYYLNVNEYSKINANEILGLMGAGLGEKLTGMNRWDYHNNIKEIPDDFLKLLVTTKKDRKNDLDLKNMLDYSPDPKGYSKDTFYAFIKNGETYALMRHLNLFEKSIGSDDLKYLIDNYSVDYPYKVRDIVSYLDKLNLDKEKKEEIIDYVFKHNYVSDKIKTSYEIEDDIKQKYQKIEDDLLNIIRVDPDSNYNINIQPENLPKEQLEKVKKFIENGYLTFFYPHIEYLKYFIKNDYEWLLDEVIKYGQENLILNSTETSLKIEDQKKYAEKLINKKRIDNLYLLIEKGLFSEDSLDDNIFKKLLENGYLAKPGSFKNLSEESFGKILSKNPFSLQYIRLYNDIDKFVFKEQSNFDEYKKYQEFVKSIENEFDLKNDETLYEHLFLDFENVKKIGFEKYKKEIIEKLDILKKKLLILYPKYENFHDRIIGFKAEFGFKILNEKTEYLDKIFDSIRHLPEKLRFGSQSLFQKFLIQIKDFSLEQKIETNKDLEELFKIFDISKTKEIFERYLYKIGNREVSNEIKDIFWVSKIMPSYMEYYKNLPEDKKKFFQEIFPWSESLVALESKQQRDKNNNYDLWEINFVPLIQESKDIINLADPLDGQMYNEFVERFGMNNIPKLFDLFIKIKRFGNIENMDLQTKNILKEDFDIDVNVLQKEEKVDINFILNKIEAIYKETFDKYIKLSKEKFIFNSDFQRREHLFDYTRILALSGEMEEKDNDQLVKFSRYYLDIKQETIHNSKLFYNKLKQPFDSKNWGSALMAYIEDAEGVRPAIYENFKKEIDTSFSGPYRDVCFNEMRNEWLKFIEDNQRQNMPIRLAVLTNKINDLGGAGNLKYVESLGNLIYQTNHSFENKHTVDRTKNEIKGLLSLQEKIFEKEKWSQDDRAEFYNLSRDVMEAAPSLYSAYFKIFEQMSAKEVKLFMKDVFPFYQAELVILQEINGEDVKYKAKDLVKTRALIDDLSKKLSSNPNEKTLILNSEKERLLGVIKTGFKNRFGLMKVPDDFSKENLRSIQNGIRYLGNISGRNSEREAIITLYLGLELNGQWSSFRGGADIKIEEYLSGDRLEILKPLLAEKAKGYEDFSKIIGITKEQMPRFQELIQEETISNMVGNIQTIDIKLGNVKRNIEELVDPDIYEDQKDKDLIELLAKEGKAVGVVLAKTYNELAGKKIEINEAERAVQLKIAKIFNVEDWNTSEVKKIQDEIGPMSLIINMINKMKEEKLDDNIEELQKRLMPSESVIKIFERLGEDFKQESGAFALSKDLTYLESLVVKDDKKITEEEKMEVANYLILIKEKMKDLENTLTKVREYFGKIKKSSHLENHELLKNRLIDIEKIIYSSDDSEMIVSHMTKNLNDIIENMRQCLGCMRKEANNDTNLAFGDYNKFFMMNRSEKEKGSISDEIVFLVPVKIQGGMQEMSFVLDRVYGSKSSDILVSNVLSVYKKYQTIKKDFPNTNLSISVSSEAMSSVGLGADILQKRLVEVMKNAQLDIVNDIVAEIPKSNFSDNYIEFGDKNARDFGERNFSGLVIR